MFKDEHIKPRQNMDGSQIKWHDFKICFAGWFSAKWTANVGTVPSYTKKTKINFPQSGTEETIPGQTLTKREWKALCPCLSRVTLHVLCICINDNLLLSEK